MRKAVAIVLGLLAVLSAVPAAAQTLDPAACGSANAPAWCSGSDMGAWINAAAGELCPAGGKIQIPAGRYTVETEAGPLCGNLEIVGAGSNQTFLIATPAFGGRIFHPAGTATAPVSALHIHSLAIENGTPTATNLTGGRDGIRCDYCRNVEFDHLSVTSIQGQYGIVTVNSSGVSVHDNTIAQFGYGGVMNLVNSGGSSADVRIVNNTVSGCMNTTTGLCYGISISGTEDNTLPNTVHAVVQGNHVSDIPTWECYDSHGGAQQTFAGNTGTDCYFGLQLGTVSGGSLQDVTVSGNSLTQSTAAVAALPNGYGIVLAGADVHSMVSGATLSNNIVDGYGAGANSAWDTTAAITLMMSENVVITGNRVPHYHQAGIGLYVYNVGVKIAGNTFGELLDAKTLAASAAVEFMSGGSWGVSLSGNAVAPTSSGTAPACAIFDAYLNTEVSVATPMTVNAAAGQVTQPACGGYYPLELNAEPSPNSAPSFSFHPGTLGYNSQGRPQYLFTAPSSNGNAPGEFYSLATKTIVATVSTVSGSVLLTASGAQGALYTWLPPGMHIVVHSAGAAGADLKAKVLRSDATSLLLDTPAAATLPAAQITWQGGAVTTY